MRNILSILVLSAFASAQPAIAPPQAGFIRDAHQSLRPVVGVGGNFLLGDSIGEGVVSCAFSGASGLVKTDSALFVLDPRGQTTYATDASLGSALFAFTPWGAPAFVYIAQSDALLAWKRDHFEAAPWDAGQIAGQILALANPAPQVLRVVAQRAGALWQLDLDPATGNIVSQAAMAAEHGPVFLTPSGELLYGDAVGFVLHNLSGAEQRIADGAERRIPARQSPVIFEQMSPSWVHVIQPGSTTHYALRIDAGRERIYQLPEAQP